MRKRFIRMLAYIYIFFIVLHRRLSVVEKRRAATGICAGVMVFALAVSLFSPGAVHLVSSEQMAAKTSLKSYNRVTTSDTMASIEINQSSVATKEKISDASAGKEKRNTVIKNISKSSGDRNAVVENPVLLSQVKALYENNGIRPENVTEGMFYQYPVEIGYMVETNYDRVQTAADYVFKDIFETKPEQEADTEDIDAQTPKDEAEAARASEGAVDGQKSENKTETMDEADVADTDRDVQTPEDKENEERQMTASERFQRDVWNVILPTSPMERSLSDSERSAHTIVKKPALSTGSKKNSQKSETPQKEHDDIAEISDKAQESDGGALESVEGETEQPNTGMALEEASAQDTGNNEKTVSESGGTEESSEEQSSSNADEVGAETEKAVTADAGYFTVRGSMRAGAGAFVGDVIIEPTGVNGFDQIRIGEDGAFGSSVVLTENGADKKVLLYFSNGSEVTNGVEYTYSKDAAAPVLAFSEEGLGRLQGNDKIIYCTKDTRLKVLPDDDLGDAGGSGIDKICYVYGDKLLYVVDNFDEAGIEVPDNFYGRILMNCSDKAGNTSDMLSKYYLVENNAPTITIAADALCTTPYTLWIDVEEQGHIVSGIQKVECSINGEPYEISDLTLLESVTIDKDVEVPSKYEFSVPFTEEGEYEIFVTVTDNAGNVSAKAQTINVTKPELVSVFMPKEFVMHIDPQQLAGKEQIYSDDITLVNNSEFGVQVSIKNIELTVKDEVSDTGVRKDCDIYLVAPDTGEHILLKKGENKEVYSYCLPEGAEGAIANLTFVGNTSEGSDFMWRSSDIMINVELEFRKWEE